MPNIQKETQQFSSELQTLAINLLSRVNSGCQIATILDGYLEKYITDNKDTIGKDKGLSPYFLLEACKYIKFSSGMDTKTILDFVANHIGKRQAIPSDSFPTEDIISVIRGMSAEERAKVSATIELEAK